MRQVQNWTAAALIGRKTGRSPFAVLILALLSALPVTFAKAQDTVDGLRMELYDAPQPRVRAIAPAQNRTGAELVVVHWYDSKAPQPKLRYQSFDVRKGEFTTDVKNRVEKFTLAPDSAVKANIQRVTLSDERGYTDDDKLKAAIARQRQSLGRKWITPDWVDVPSARLEGGTKSFMLETATAVKSDRLVFDDSAKKQILGSWEGKSDWQSGTGKPNTITFKEDGTTWGNMTYPNTGGWYMKGDEIHVVGKAAADPEWGTTTHLVLVRQNDTLSLKSDYSTYGNKVANDRIRSVTLKRK